MLGLSGKPQHSHGLTDNTSISPEVTFWKGGWKPLAAIGFAASFASRVLHYVGVWANRCLLYRSPSPRGGTTSTMPSSAWKSKTRSLEQ
ncbi:formate dehydrogenase N subunit beta transmembrane domain-containing protein, partial [Serratia marcescens]|uniref:formate dehydrogenase N subunit beta transmembrane domain-containing protein n=1 Tax=Serratia marcescens TaxID=615 RepID=UPI00355BE6B8